MHYPRPLQVQQCSHQRPQHFLPLLTGRVLISAEIEVEGGPFEVLHGQVE